MHNFSPTWEPLDPEEHLIITISILYQFLIAYMSCLVLIFDVFKTNAWTSETSGLVHTTCFSSVQLAILLGLPLYFYIWIFCICLDVKTWPYRYRHSGWHSQSPDDSSACTFCCNDVFSSSSSFSSWVYALFPRQHLYTEPAWIRLNIMTTDYCVQASWKVAFCEFLRDFVCLYQV